MNNQQVRTLKQKDRFGREFEFALFEGRELSIGFKNNRQRLAYNIDLVALNPRSRREIIWGWKWLYAALAVSGILAIALYAIPYLVTTGSDAIRGVLFLSGVILIVSFILLFFKNTTRQQSFYSRHAGVPLVRLMIGKPDKASQQQFVEHLQQRILKLQSHLDLEIDKQLAGEMKMLRRLTEQGVVTEQRYNQAKDKLFKLHT